jgi:diguanylate cyclase (GGDEF)-like protein
MQFMRLWQRIARSRRSTALPTDIYISLVSSLFSEARTLFLGSIATSLAVFLTAWKASDPWLLACAVALILVTCVRALNMRMAARRQASLTIEQAAQWEFHYALGASAFSLLLGLWCVIAFVWLDDPFVRAVSLASNIAYAIGTAGRNFASKAIVRSQTISAALPISIALLLSGEVAYGIFAVLLLAFFASFKFIADRLRRTLLDAVIATRDVSLLANRFDTALNNMPHGLCMFEADGTLAVFNKRLVELLGASVENVKRSASARQLLRGCAQSGLIPASSVDHISADIEAHLSGEAKGELAVETTNGRTLVLTFQAMDNGGSVMLAEDVTDRKNAEAKIQYLARYDALTGLLNRTSFREHMERALKATRRGGSVAVLFVDLDQFKQVNDTLGHPIGDALLCNVAERLRGIVRESDEVARFGGDEFVVLQAPVEGPDQAASLARRIVDVIGTTYEVNGNQLVIGASIGIAMAPCDGRDADLLLKNADMALYRAKSDGRAGWRFFEPDMDVKAQARRSLELDLRNAVANDAFELHYQPIFDLKTRRVATCEALLRWPHPERGMVSPAEFIPIAEEMGLIVEIGQQVLNKACLECTKWPSDVRVAVNLSPIQFRRGGVTTAVRHALALCGLDPNRLEIEITESVLLQHTHSTRVSLQQLRDLGVRISLDDFGTGYSSLSYLLNFPFHKVKIDRSFLEGIESEGRSLTLLRGVAQLSAQLGLSVVVEGVETAQQLGLIMGEPSIGEAQGFLFSRPVTSRDVRKLLYARTTLADRVA